MGIKGFVLNDSKGVIIEAEGDGIDGFIQYLKTSYPPLAQIEDIKTSILTTEGLSTLISPDIAICKDCLKELFDPSDRRYLYPFINCTNCGPRYSIIHSIPYDRPNTTMKAFRMCKDCEEEYHDPSNRRFHTQPNACPECGPRLGFRAGEKYPLKAAIECLRQGAIVAIKGFGGFHLTCDATKVLFNALIMTSGNLSEEPIVTDNQDALERLSSIADAFLLHDRGIYPFHFLSSVGQGGMCHHP